MRVVEQSKDWDLYIPLVGNFTLDHKSDTKFNEFMFYCIRDTDFFIPDYVLASSKDLSKLYYPYRLGLDNGIIYIELELAVWGNFCTFTFRDLYKLLKAYYRVRADDIILMRSNMDFLNVLFQKFKDARFRLDLNAGSKKLLWADSVSSYWQTANTKVKIAKNVSIADLSDTKGVVIEALFITGRKHYVSCYPLKSLKSCNPVLELQFSDLGIKFDVMHKGKLMFYKMISIPNEDIFYTTLMLHPSKRVFQDIVGDAFKVISCLVINDELEFR